METIQLTIPDMKSLHCQMTVTKAVQVLGANMKSVAPTHAEIELVHGLSRAAVVAAIRNAGYTVVD